MKYMNRFSVSIWEYLALKKKVMSATVYFRRLKLPARAEYLPFEMPSSLLGTLNAIHTLS